MLLNQALPRWCVWCRKSLQVTGKSVMYCFNNDTLDEAGVRRGCPPFAVVGSNKMDLSVGSFWPVRSYPWGRCEALSSRHSDVPSLRRLLLEVGYQELKQHTENRFYAYRRKHCTEVGLPRSSKEQPGPIKLLVRLGCAAVLAVVASLALPPLIGDIVDTKKGKLVARVESTVAKAEQAGRDMGQKIANAVQAVAAPEPEPQPEPPKKKRGWLF